MKNILNIFAKNFSLLSYPLFIAGVVYLYRKNKRVLSFASLSLLLFGPFLAKITFSGQSHTGEEYYLSAHQYYLPAFAFYVFFLGAGFVQASYLLRRWDLRILQKALPVIFAVFPIVFLVSRATDSNFRTNYVAYQFAKDMHSILPINSIFMAFGDNEAYQGWYLKLIGRYREDNCMLSIPHQEDTVWLFEGCDKRIYGDIYPVIFKHSVDEMAASMVNMRFYGTAIITKDFVFWKYMQSRFYSLQSIYLPTEYLVKNVDELNSFADRFLKERLPIADKLIYPEICLSHLTDDNFTEAICSRYLFHLIEISKLYSDKQYGATGKDVDIEMRSKVLSLSDISYKIPLTKKNAYYLDLFYRINRFNQWEIFYIRER